MKKVILTGDRPTGRLHVGHYVGSLKERVRLQNSGEYDEIYVMIADAQALTDNADNPEKVRQNILQVALDYLACGIDPGQDPHLYPVHGAGADGTELLLYESGHREPPATQPHREERDPDAQLRDQHPGGAFTPSVTADITAFKATTVPAGEDQKPMIEQCCEIVHKFNSVYGDTLVEPEIVLPQNAACLRLPGIRRARAKMSKRAWAIRSICRGAEDIKKKVRSMHTDPNHQEAGPRPGGGQPGVHLSGRLLPPGVLSSAEYQNLDEVKAHHQRGGLAMWKVKKFLNIVMAAELEPIRTRRKEGSSARRKWWRS